MEEVELNATFNCFVANYKAAYEGRNIRRDQIIDSTKSNRPSDLERKCQIIFTLLAAATVSLWVEFSNWRAKQAQLQMINRYLYMYIYIFESMYVNMRMHI